MNGSLKPNAPHSWPLRSPPKQYPSFIHPATPHPAREGSLPHRKAFMAHCEGVPLLHSQSDKAELVPLGPVPGTGLVAWVPDTPSKAELSQAPERGP